MMLIVKKDRGMGLPHDHCHAQLRHQQSRSKIALQYPMPSKSHSSILLTLEQYSKNGLGFRSGGMQSLSFACSCQVHLP